MPLAKVNPVTVDQTIPARRKYLAMTELEKQQIQDIMTEYK